MEQGPQNRGKAGMILAAVATASVGALVGLTVTGILSRLPAWAGVTIVVIELAFPFVVYKLVKRAEKRHRDR